MADKLTEYHYKKRKNANLRQKKYIQRKKTLNTTNTTNRTVPNTNVDTDIPNTNQQTSQSTESEDNEVVDVQNNEETERDRPDLIFSTIPINQNTNTSTLFSPEIVTTNNFVDLSPHNSSDEDENPQNPQNSTNFNDLNDSITIRRISFENQNNNNNNNNNNHDNDDNNSDNNNREDNLIGLNNDNENNRESSINPTNLGINSNNNVIRERRRIINNRDSDFEYGNLSSIIGSSTLNDLNNNSVDFMLEDEAINTTFASESSLSVPITPKIVQLLKNKTFPPTFKEETNFLNDNNVHPIYNYCINPHTINSFNDFANPAILNLISTLKFDINLFLIKDSSFFVDFVFFLNSKMNKSSNDTVNKFNKECIEVLSKQKIQKVNSFQEVGKFITVFVMVTINSILLNVHALYVGL